MPHGYSNDDATGAWGENEMLRQSLSALGGTPRSVIVAGIAAVWSEGSSVPHRQIMVDARYAGRQRVAITGGVVTLVQHLRS